MKTLLVCADKKLEDHAGEEYDEILEVDNAPNTSTIQEWGYRVRNCIRRLWNEDKDEQKGVVVVLDGPSPYNVMLINLQIIMAEKERIGIELPYRQDDDIVELPEEIKKIIGE